MWLTSVKDLFSRSPRRRRKPVPGRARRSAARRLVVESLEDRRLLSGDFVGWLHGEHPGFPGDTLHPPAPTTNDVIAFTLRVLEDRVYDNPCFAAAAHGGTPALAIDAEARTIDVVFVPDDPPPPGGFIACPLIYAPVSALQGQVGPLEAGDWTLNGPMSSIPFTVQASTPIVLPFETIGQGAFSGYRYGDADFAEGEDQVILDPGTWAEFWAQHTSNLFPPPELPVVDFDTEMVISTHMGYRTSGGYSTEIQEVVFDAETGILTVRVREVSPEPGDVVTAVITNPFHIVRVQRVDYTAVVFELV